MNRRIGVLLLVPVAVFLCQSFKASDADGHVFKKPKDVIAWLYRDLAFDAMMEEPPWENASLIQQPRITLLLSSTAEKAASVLSNHKGYMNTRNSIRDVVNHPSFKGFGQFILPLDQGVYDENMHLSRVAYLLPYHSHVDPEAVMSTINYLIDQVAEGRTTFCNFYTERQRLEDPDRKNTGLFFFKGKPGAPFVIVCPGGGFSYVGSVHEGFPHAIQLSKKGYNAFVLQYRVGGEKRACDSRRKYFYFEGRKYWHMGEPHSEDSEKWPNVINRTWVDVRRHAANVKHRWTAEEVELQMRLWEIQLEKSSDRPKSEATP